MGRTLLVVDDDPVVSAFIAELAKRKGFEVRVANNSRAVERALDEGAPDLVMLDILMPEQDGFEVMDAMARRGWAVSIVLTTAYPQYLSLAERYGQGRGHRIIGHLDKPIRLDRLAGFLD